MLRRVEQAWVAVGEPFTANAYRNWRRHMVASEDMLIPQVESNRPPTAAERRVSELGFLARLLDERPQSPERLPYVDRKIYDERRKTDAPMAPSSARLQVRFGSWPRVCPTPLSVFLRTVAQLDQGKPWAQRPPRRGRVTVEDAEASVRLSAKAIGRIPSSYEYHFWVANRRARERRTGREIDTVTYASVMRLLAPERRNRNGWDVVTLRVFGAPRSGNDPIE